MQLYVNYKKVTTMIKEGDKLYANRNFLQQVGPDRYALDEKTIIRLFSHVDHMDERTIAMISNMDFKRVNAPVDIVYAANNNIEGYLYPSYRYKERTDSMKLEKVINYLQSLKEDVTKLGEKGIYIGTLTPENVTNLRITDPDGFRRAHNEGNQTRRNIDEINEFYFQYRYQIKGQAFSFLMQDYIRSNYQYIGDYLEDNAPTFLNQEGYEKVMCRRLKIDN